MMYRLSSRVLCATALTSLLSFSVHGLQRYFGYGNVTCNVPIFSQNTTDNAGWYAYFDLGASTNVQVAVDFQIYPILILPSQYHPSSKSRNLHTKSKYESDEFDGDEISYNEYTDVFGIPGLSISNASFAVIDGFGSNYDKQSEQHVGPAVAFGPPFMSPYVLPEWLLDEWHEGLLPQLCWKGLAECRMGVVLENQTAGQFIFGEDDVTLHEGELTTSPLVDCNHCGFYTGFWMSAANIVTPNRVFKPSNGFPSNATFALSYRDIGGPRNVVRDVFLDQGVKVVTKFVTLETPNDYEYIYGEFPCDKPPMIGFQIGGAEFYLTGAAAIRNELGNNSCQSTLVGQGFTNSDDGDDFYLGSAFLEGHYVELNLESRTLGVANKTTSGASRFAGEGQMTLPLITVLNVLALWWFC